MVQTRSVHIGNREWTLIAEIDAAALESNATDKYMAFIIAGLLGSILLPVLIGLLQRENRSLQTSEQRFADFAEISSDWYWETDQDLRLTYISPQIETVTGIRPEDRLGLNLLDLAPARPGSDRADRFIGMISRHEAFRDFETLFSDIHGQKIYISISGKPVYDKGGDFHGYRGVGRDISERKLAEEQVNLALRHAEAANRSKSEFLATLSHEFRTPLNAILGFSDTIRQRLFGPIGSTRYEEYAESIHASGNHLLNLINDVLDMAAIEAGGRSYVFEALGLNALVHEAVRHVIVQANRKDIRITVAIPPKTPSLVADRRSVIQILLNLLSNAVKFTPEGGRIEISAKASQDEILLSVEDNGEGIPEDQLEAILEPFVQAQTHPRQARGGTGLGLSIVKSLMDGHEGYLTIRSTLGEGTRVDLHFPRTLKAEAMPETMDA